MTFPVLAAHLLGFTDHLTTGTPLLFYTSEAEEMIDGTWAGRKLNGYRNIPPADRYAVLDALSRLAQLAADFPQLQEIEINPLVVFPKGQGVLALDVRVRGSLT